MYTVINQEKFIFNGLVDELNNLSISSVAPFKKYGKIEWSKLFARDIMEKNNLSHYNPSYKYCKKYNENEILILFQN